jgi:hypothetical protein
MIQHWFKIYFLKGKVIEEMKSNQNIFKCFILFLKESDTQQQN